MRWIILLVALATLSAGCFGGGAKMLSPEEAEATAEDALRSFAEDFASADGGDLTKVTGEFSFTQGSTQSATFTLEWGRQGTAMIKLDAGGDFGAALEMYCGQDRNVLILAGESVEMRATPGRACTNSFQDSGDPLDVASFEDLDLLNVTANSDGTVTAVYDDEQGRIAIKIDTRGRITRMDMDTETGDGYLVMSYGARRLISVPDADERMPAMINGFGSHNGQVYQWTGFGGDEAFPQGEFEVRVVQRDTQEVVASFPVGDDATMDGFRYAFIDDGDGMFGGGDAFSIQKDGWNSESQYQVVVWDTWADRALGDYPIPGFGPLAFLGLLGAVLLARR